MPFIGTTDHDAVASAPGARARTPDGEHRTLCDAGMDAGADGPRHRHSHESGGLRIRGWMKMTFGGRARACELADRFMIRPDPSHGARPIDGPVVVGDGLGPGREDDEELLNRYVPSV